MFRATLLQVHHCCMYMTYWSVDTEARSVFFARAGGARKGYEVAFAELDKQFVLLNERLAESMCRTYAAACMRACVRDLAALACSSY